MNMTKLLSISTNISRFFRRNRHIYIFFIGFLLFIMLTLQIKTHLFPNNYEKLSTQMSDQESTNDKLKNSQHILPLIYQPAIDVKISRALLVFYPSDLESMFELELRWFYHSWTNMMKNESSLWRTDLIVYTSTNLPILKKLGCVFNKIRSDLNESPKCRVFPYISIKNRQSNHRSLGNYQEIDRERSQNLYKYLRNYGYIDSINSIFEYSSSYLMYDYVVRTDLDCFLTENFGRYIPYENSLLVGMGGYSTKFNNQRLKRIARDMNWSYADKNSLGSTWYGPAAMVYQIANYTIDAMMHLVLNEFTQPERDSKVGVMLWPEWHFGVLLLYGGHLAMNHLIGKEHFDIVLADQLLDQGVTYTDQNDLNDNHRLHLHCWHTDVPFSKFVFKAGRYDNIAIESLASDTSASGLAMRLALESKRSTLAQLKHKLLDIKKA